MRTSTTTKVAAAAAVALVGLLVLGVQQQRTLHDIATNREVVVTNIVETAASRDATLYGYCTRAGGRASYDLHITAMSGGTEKLVAGGRYASAAAEALGAEIAAWYGASLSFGDSSEQCDRDLASWGTADEP